LSSRLVKNARVTIRTLSPLPSLVRATAAAWVAAATYVFIVEGVLDAPHLWAPYLGIVLWTPIWLVGASLRRFPVVGKCVEKPFDERGGSRSCSRTFRSDWRDA